MSGSFVRWNTCQNGKGNLSILLECWNYKRELSVISLDLTTYTIIFWVILCSRIEDRLNAVTEIMQSDHVILKKIKDLISGLPDIEKALVSIIHGKVRCTKTRIYYIYLLKLFCILVSEFVYQYRFHRWIFVNWQNVCKQYTMNWWSTKIWFQQKSTVHFFSSCFLIQHYFLRTFLRGLMQLMKRPLSKSTVKVFGTTMCLRCDRFLPVK